MRYVIARYKQYQCDLAYRFYITDCLRIVTADRRLENLPERYRDVIFKSQSKEVVVGEPTRRIRSILSERG